MVDPQPWQLEGSWVVEPQEPHQPWQLEGSWVVELQEPQKPWQLEVHGEESAMRNAAPASPCPRQHGPHGQTTDDR